VFLQSDHVNDVYACVIYYRRIYMLVFIKRVCVFRVMGQCVLKFIPLRVGEETFTNKQAFSMVHAWFKWRTKWSEEQARNTLKMNC